MFKTQSPDRFDKYDPEVRDDPNWLIKKKEFAAKRPKPPPPRVKPDIRPPAEIIHKDFSTKNKTKLVEFALNFAAKKEENASQASPTRLKKAPTLDAKSEKKTSEKEILPKADGVNYIKLMALDLESRRGDALKSPTKEGVKDRDVRALNSPGKPNLEAMRNTSKDKSTNQTYDQIIPNEASNEKKDAKSVSKVQKDNKKTTMSEKKNPTKRDTSTDPLKPQKGKKSSSKIKKGKGKDKNIKIMNQDFEEDKLQEEIENEISDDSYILNNPVKKMQTLANALDF